MLDIECSTGIDRDSQGLREGGKHPRQMQPGLGHLGQVWGKDPLPWMIALWKYIWCNPCKLSKATMSNFNTMHFSFAMMVYTLLKFL